jgi:predicted component of type VI protein secretion system
VNVVAPLLAAGAGPTRSPAYQPLVLRVLGGAHAGRRITVERDGFVIGRDAGCALRCAAESVSRQHAALVWGPAGWLVMDLSSTNGTWHNGRRVVRPRDLRVGDTIRVGPLSLEVAPLEECAGGEGPAALDLAIPDEAGRDTLADAAPAGVPLEAVAGVWVVAPRHAAAPDDAALDAWRVALERLAARPESPRIVIDLEHVAELSSRAVGLIVAWAIELKGRGGALRLAHPQASVRARLEWLRVPMLVPLFLQRDEAVIAAWE